MMKKQIPSNNFESWTGGQRFRRCSHRLSALFLFLFLFLAVAKGGVTITVTEHFDGVTVSASGTLNLGELELGGGTAGVVPSIRPNRARFALGPKTPADTPLTPFRVDHYRAPVGEVITRPSSFGSGAFTDASRGAGDMFGYIFPDISSGEEFRFIQVPAGYVSGGPITSSATFDGATIASLGLIPGRYDWLWGVGDNADSITLIVPSGEPVILPPPPAVDNAVKKARLLRTLASYKRLLKEAQRTRRPSVAVRLHAIIIDLTRRLRRL